MDTSSTLVNAEPIPGYTLEERLGRGAYGEVWKALAPGSMYKAVKVIHGFHDDELARRELDALERIKGVRHPFLISIERIEVCDGQLVIVTELADMSLRDRFDDYRESGKIGIPRDELLAHLCDVADALDYISERHNLQHLDVKPENLMFVGGRLKVGDFGLVKDLQQISASIMSALTPVYAPPELFDGRPHCHSDQYSLAIVYQEMLAGQRPFRGPRAAELMSQHLKDPPDLDSLPTSDRGILAKALAKNPELRFGSCRELVDRLLNVDQPRDDLPREAVSNDADSSDLVVGQTIVESPVLQRPGNGSIGSIDTHDIRSTTTVRANRVVDLPRVEMPQENVRLRPTLFLGIGEIGARSLRKLRRRLTDRFGEKASVPAFRLLYVDADLKAIVHATQGEETIALEPHETLAMPLRRTQAYGVEKTKFLRWLSRRWLYNIPRSLNTEGRRPLGRVAFVDHVEVLLERLRDIIAAMTSADALVAAGEATGHEFSDAAPRVFIVSSVCGGTGGGMVLDMAYAVRQVLREQGLKDDAVHGVLTYSSPRDPEAQELAAANAYATLTELHHYSSPGRAYPGAEDCGLAATSANDVTFPSVSVLHLGDGLTEEQFENSAEQLAEYFYLDATTACGTAFDEIDKTAKLTAPLDPAIVPLRTFRLHPRGGLQADIFDQVVSDLCHHLIDRWLGTMRNNSATFDGTEETDAAGGHNGADDAVKPFVQEEAAKLAVDALVPRIHRSAIERLGSPPRTFLAGLISEASPEATLGAIDLLTEAADDRDHEVSGAEPARLPEAVATDAKRIGTEHGRALRQRVLQLADHPDVGVRGAQWVATQLRGRIDVSRRETAELMQHNEALLKQLRAAYLAQNTSRKRIVALAVSSEDSSSQRDDLLLEYLLTRLGNIAIASVQRMLRSIGESALQTLQDLASITCRLESLSEQIPGSGDDGTHIPDSSLGINAHLNALARKSLAGRRDELVRRLDELVRQAWLEQREGLSSLAHSDSVMEDELTAEVSRHARATVAGALRHLDFAGEIVSLAEVDEEGMQCFRTWLEDTRPPVLDAGGARTYVLAVGPEANPRRLQELIEAESQSHCSVVLHPDAALALACCGEQLSLGDVAGRLIQGPRFAEIAHRLHTRIDVDWKAMK